MQGKLFQRCRHLLYWSVLSLGGNVNTKRMKKPDTGSIFHVKNQRNILVIGNYYVKYQNYQNLRLLIAINFPCINNLGSKKQLKSLWILKNWYAFFLSCTILLFTFFIKSEPKTMELKTTLKQCFKCVVKKQKFY